MKLETTKPKTFCFVLMPFDSAFDDIYGLGIKATCAESGAYCERVDEQIFQESMIDRIYNQISKADIVIADMTGKNANVFYEVGYAHALGKPTILLTQNANDIPFDLKQYPHIIYGSSISKLKSLLAPRIDWFISNPRTSENEYQIAIELYYGNKSLSKGEAVYLLNDSFPDINFDIIIHNTSTITYEPGDFTLGVVCDKKYSLNLNIHSDLYPTKLPDGKYLYVASKFDTLFPQVYTSLSIAFAIHGSSQKDHNDVLIFKVFTKSGTREYPLTISWK